MIRLARYVLVATLMISIGAQWAVMQTAAWVGMAVSYTIKSGSVSEGLSKTFDGKHPCKLCNVVKKGTDSEKKDPKQETAKKKIELFASTETILVVATPVADALPRAESFSAFVRTIAPPLQPPRCA